MKTIQVYNSNKIITKSGVVYEFFFIYNTERKIKLLRPKVKFCKNFQSFVHTNYNNNWRNSVKFNGKSCAKKKRAAKIVKKTIPQNSRICESSQLNEKYGFTLRNRSLHRWGMIIVKSLHSYVAFNNFFNQESAPESRIPMVSKTSPNSPKRNSIEKKMNYF